MQTNDEIIHAEIESILNDITALYIKEGKKVTGQFADGLSAEYLPNEATIKGYTYLAGRGPTKKAGKAGEPTLQEQILKWIKAKGIKGKKDDIKASSLAFLIARKIHKEGTNSDFWLKIYEQVITPQRIDSIIEKVAELNVNKIINTVTAELEILAKNV